MADRLQWARNRLRKYARKKFRASDPRGLLFWRYWHKVNGGHRMIWGDL
jgi:hypothetical protein